ncbi:MAG: hypothetical protein ABL870_05765 [Sediminibacterium sp.]
MDALLNTDKGNGTATLESLTITQSKFSGIDDSNQIERVGQKNQRTGS